MVCPGSLIDTLADTLADTLVYTLVGTLIGTLYWPVETAHRLVLISTKFKYDYMEKSSAKWTA